MATWQPSLGRAVWGRTSAMTDRRWSAAQGNEPGLRKEGGARPRERGGRGKETRDESHLTRVLPFKAAAPTGNRGICGLVIYSQPRSHLGSAWLGTSVGMGAVQWSPPEENRPHRAYRSFSSGGSTGIVIKTARAASIAPQNSKVRNNLAAKRPP
jgi:hypothetical protein